MMRKSALVAVLAAVSAATALAAGAPKAPPLSGVDPVTGKHVSLAAYGGRPVVVNVWASWCGGCRQEASALAAFVHSHPKLAVMGIDSMDTKAGARAFYRVYDIEYPSIFDPTGAIGAKLKVIGIPTTFFLDREHRIAATVAGAGTLARFNAALRAALHA